MKWFGAVHRNTGRHHDTFIHETFPCPSDFFMIRFMIWHCSLWENWLNAARERLKIRKYVPGFFLQRTCMRHGWCSPTYMESERWSAHTFSWDVFYVSGIHQIHSHFWGMWVASRDWGTKIKDIIGFVQRKMKQNRGFFAKMLEISFCYIFFVSKPFFMLFGVF